MWTLKKRQIVGLMFVYRIAINSIVHVFIHCLSEAQTQTNEFVAVCLKINLLFITICILNIYLISNTFNKNHILFFLTKHCLQTVLQGRCNQVWNLSFINDGRLLTWLRFILQINLVDLFNCINTIVKYLMDRLWRYP
jgi:hypothetical protein